MLAALERRGADCDDSMTVSRKLALRQHNECSGSAPEKRVGAREVTMMVCEETGGSRKMGKRDRVIACVATKDAAYARNFCEQVLGFRIVQDDDTALVFDANGTLIRITKVDHR
jgi:hypothetical protein